METENLPHLMMGESRKFIKVRTSIFEKNSHDQNSESDFPQLKTEERINDLQRIEMVLRKVIRQERLNDDIESILPIKGAYYGR